MKILKRLLLVVILSFATISATACGSNSNKTSEKSNDFELLNTLVLEQPTGLKIEISYYGKGDIAFKQTAKNEVPYSVFGGKENAEKQINPIIEQYKNLKGVTHKVEFLEDKAVENLEVNFKELDLEKAKNVPGLILDGGNPNNGVSVSKSVEILKKQGFTEKK